MNDSTSSEQRSVVSSLLTPTVTSTFKEIWLHDNATEFTFNEYRLNGIPESLEAFVDQFLKENGGYDKVRLIWTSENSFVCVGVDRLDLDGLPLVYQKHGFLLELTSGSKSIPLHIYSRTREDAMSSLDLLVGLHDDHFEKLELSDLNHSGEDEEDEPKLCPLTSVLLQKMIVQNANRQCSFSDMTFNPDQSRTLATSGTKTDIEFCGCRFQEDYRETFLEALAAREDPATGLATLTIVGCLPFADGILVLLLDQCEIISLTLIGIDLETEEACCALAAAELEYLSLSWCELADGGAALVESVREGRGPKELGLSKSDEGDDYDWIPFDSPERFISFLNALRGNSHLERLVLSDQDFREEGILDALTAALFANLGLIHLGLSVCSLDESGFCDFFRALSAHPSMRTLNLTFRDLDMDNTAATKAVAEMLSVNRQLERIYFRDNDDDDDDDSPFDSAAWDKLVIPRLECNVYRKRFPAIQNIRSQSTRAAVMVRALSHANDKPSPAFMLLRQNVDILASYSCEESQIATSSRKRSHSPSSDGMVVSNVGSP
jgi:hypothetical protein